MKKDRKGARDEAAMIHFEEMKLDGSSPIYLQIIDFIKGGLAAGTIVSGDELPSRRMLSALLGINPNTVQKAYAMLEAEGLIHSHTGAKSCISARPRQIDEIRGTLAEEGGRRAVQTLKAAGYSKEEAIAMIRRYWDAEEGTDRADAHAKKTQGAEAAEEPETPGAKKEKGCEYL